jgi:predicted nucleic acid-binding protein
LVLREAAAEGSLHVHVPSLFLYEFGNLMISKSRFDIDQLTRAFRALIGLPLVIVPPGLPLLLVAAQLARAFDLSFYDASFLALSVELRCPFVTADRKLLNRLRDVPRVRHLSEAHTLDA